MSPSPTLYQAWGAFNQDVGKTLITDGPFAETREQLGVVLIFDCKDLDEAIMWASKVPDAQHGCIELRPLWDG